MEERVYNPQRVDDIDALKGICGVYQIRNIINGHLYIGSSNNLFYRYKEHLKMLKANRHDNIHLQRAFNTYGKENMVFEIIESNIDTSQQFIIEQYWIDKFYGENCYNINPIASKPPSAKGKKMPPVSAETRRKLSESMKKRYREDPELRKRMSLVRIGKHLGAEHHNSKVVVCLETGEVYAGMNEAERKTGCSRCGISECCSGKGYEVNGFHFRYKEDYDKLSKEEIEEIIFTENGSKQVVCLETGKKYKKVIDAAADTGIGRDSIVDCCEHRIIEESVKWTHWVYYAEYKNMTEDDIKKRLNEHTSVFARCVCLETGKHYNRISDAAKDLNVPQAKITLVCQRKRRSTGGLHFLYEEEYDKLSEEEIQQTINNKYIPKVKACVCLETKKVYKSVKDASKDTSIPHNNIADACSSKTYKRTKGLHWRYLEDYKNLSEEEINEIIANKKLKPLGKEVVCLETGVVYTSQVEAGKLLNINSSNISAVCCKQTRTAEGFHFCFKEEYDKLSEEEIQAIIHEPPHKPNCPQKKCICVETGKVFNSIKEASLEMNIDASNIIRVCKGRRKSAKGYTFRYQD